MGLCSVSFAPDPTPVRGGSDRQAPRVWKTAFARQWPLAVSDNAFSRVPGNQPVGALNLTRIGGLHHFGYIAFGYNRKYYQVSLSPFNIQFKLS